MFTIAPTSVPSIPLTLQINWNGPEIAGISTNSLSFHDMTPQPVIVTGVSSSASHDIADLHRMEESFQHIRRQNIQSIHTSRVRRTSIYRHQHFCIGCEQEYSLASMHCHQTLYLLGGNITLYGMLVDMLF